MKRKSLLWFTLFPLFLLQGCGGGGVISFDAVDGSKIRVKKETVSCINRFSNDILVGLLQNCTAAGIRTDLLGKKTHWSNSASCASGTSYKSFKRNENTIVCQSVKAVGIEPNFNDQDFYN